MPHSIIAANRNVLSRLTLGIQVDFEERVLERLKVPVNFFLQVQMKIE